MSINPIGKAASVEYISRMYYDWEDVDLLKTALANDQNVLLMGPKGTGKNSLAEAVAHELKLHLSFIPCHDGATTEDILGGWLPRDDGNGYRWVDGILTAAVRHGGIVFLDEINALKPQVAFAIHGLLDGRRRLVLTEHPVEGRPETIQAHADFGLVGAYNPGYEGTRELNEAFRDRFQIQLRMGYVSDIDKLVIADHPAASDLEQHEIAALQLFVDKTYRARESGAVYSEIGTRAYIDLLVNYSLYGFKVARTIFNSRFDDEAEVKAITTCFRDCWDDQGNPIHGKPSKKETKKNSKRAGRFSSRADNRTRAEAADF